MLTFLDLEYVPFNKLGPWTSQTVSYGKRRDNSIGL